MLDQIISDIKPKMQKTLIHLEDELRSIRGSRAQVGLVDTLKVEVYGQEMLLKQIATITTPDGKTIAITPWDKANIATIGKSITDNQGLGLTPSNDGNMIRLAMPPLTEERRRQMIKMVSQKLEACKISLRNIRHEAINDLHHRHRDEEISDQQLNDLEHKLKEQLNKIIEDYSKRADDIYKLKEKEMMEV
ncbi:MAG: ribosome recycling factor [bacterium]|nr:ribosome recycling factor [bacterium]